MTLVIGIKCSDGVVVGADGAAATATATGQPIGMQSFRKLSILSKSAIFGFSGPVGLGQMLRPVIQEMVTKGEFSPKGPTPKSSASAMADVRKKLWPVIQGELAVATETAKLIGNNAAFQAVACATMLAVPVSKEPCLFQFSYQGNPCESTIDLPFFSIGSGEQVSDPFLAFIRRNLWPDRFPTIAEATFAACWTLDYAIKGAPNLLIGEPKQIAVLRKGDKGWVAEGLESDALEEHKQSVDAIHEAMRNFRDNLSSSVQQDETSPPPAP